MAKGGMGDLGNLMKQAGYQTAMFGKYHMGGHFYLKDRPGHFALNEEDYQKIDFSQSFGMGPRGLGFDYSFMLLSGIQDEPYAYFENDKLVGDPGRLGVVRNSGTTGFGMPYWKTSAVGPIMTGKVLDFLGRHLDENRQAEIQRPFFVYYCSQAIHSPIAPASAVLGTPVRGQTFDKVGGFISKMAFWNRDNSEDYSGAYQIYAQPVGESTRVYIKYADGTDCEPDAAEHMLQVLSERMG